MGTDYYAYGIIGLRVEPEQLFNVVKEQVRACKCDVPTDTKFCPSCGHRMFNYITRKEFLFDGDKDWEWEDNAMVNGYKVVWGTDRDEAVIAAWYVSSHPWNDEKSFINVQDGLLSARINMKERLHNTGLWDDRKFGLHVILRVSY